MSQVDVKGGQLTFGQRIELGQIITDPALTEYQKFNLCMVCLNPEWSVAHLRKSIKYWEEVLDGIRYWVERERELKYNPTPEELAAGVEALALAVGEMSTIMALAKDFGKDPDVILGWKYGKVYNILFTNLQSFLFRDRLNKRLAEKAKAEAQRGRQGKR